ncbi:MAG: Crp/Fnr family transcriptional regulator [Anaerolineae bacterium]|nr:Crp/Fnr family transcriptional regulator [Anaerolineales bacterium]MCQ3977589.1 Crp/Fnr family transcriptional regulator [Anaerolineae bacterium]
MSGSDPSSLDVRALRQINLFEGLTENELKSICQAARLSRVKPDAFFFYQEDPADKWYILIQGQVKMTQIGPEGQQVLVRMVAPYGEFGSVALLTGLTYPLSAQAAEDCLALTWDKTIITTLLSSYPRLAMNALRLMAERFRELQERYRELATERVEQRVVRALLRLERQAGRRLERGTLIDLSLSRQDLAEMTGTTLYTVSRILSQWEQQGLIKTGREKVIILNQPGLLSIVEELPHNGSPQTPL